MKAVAYMRTSSAANVGGDSDKRQRDAIEEYARRNDIEIEAWFYDAAVSGADPVMERDGFVEMFNHLQIESETVAAMNNGLPLNAELLHPTRTILIENASRFARDLAVQIAGHDMLRKNGMHLIPVDAPNHFLEDTPTAVMVRQILGAVSQFEKSNLVAKLKKARDRIRASVGKCEGRKSYKEMYPEVVEEAKRLHRLGRSHREVAAQLLAAGFRGPHPDSTDVAWSTQAISAMIRQ